MLALASMNLVSAQNVIWSDNFDDINISDWTTFDQDGDSHNWSPVQSTDSAGNPSGTPVLTSASYINNLGPLTPNNWATSPVIDLTNASGNITLKYGVFASDADWNGENYTVYVSTTNNYTDLSQFTSVLTESSVPGTETLRTIDISSYAGSQIYISFRHHNVTDMYRINIDNVSVEASTLGVNDIAASKISVYPNPVVDEFKINTGSKFNSSKTEITVTDISGKKVKTFKASNVYNVADLPKGVYVIKVTDGENTHTQKLIKK